MEKTFTLSPLAGKGAASKAKSKRRRQEQMAAWVGVHEKDTMLIPLGKNAFAKVDADMYDFLNQWNWHISAFGYAIRFIDRDVVWMHKLVCPCEPGFEVDHINRDRTDNRRQNLRPATKVQNQGNRWKSSLGKTSKFKGVSRDSRSNCFAAYGRQHDRTFNLGTFKIEIEAAKAYNEWAKEYFGEFAMLNPV